MKIGIIGAGNIGGALTRRLTALGQEVKVANSRGPETLAVLATETGAKAVSAREAVRDAEVLIVTIPQKNVPSLPAGLFNDAREDLVVVDTGNYYPQQRDGRIEDIEAGMTESRWVALQLGRPVVKAFNNIYAAHLLGLGKPPVPPTASLCPLPATMRLPRQWCCGSSTSSASTASTPADWTALGANSPAVPYTARTRTQRGCEARYPRRLADVLPSSGGNRRGRNDMTEQSNRGKDRSRGAWAIRGSQSPPSW